MPNTRVPEAERIDWAPIATNDSLLATVLEAVDEVLRGSEGLLSAQVTIPKDRVHLLKLLTYCYAEGLYHSEDIVRAVRHNPMLRWLAAGDFPEAAALRAFRRRHVEALTSALALVLEQVLEPVLPAPRACSVRRRYAGGYVARSLDRWGDYSAGASLPSQEALRRIQRAIRADSAWLDE